METKKVLILGSLGMLGQELTRIFSLDQKYEIFSWDKDTLDITDFDLFEERLAAVQPDVVINAAAYNAVDRCEQNDEEYEKALILNRDVPEFLAEESMKLGFLLVQYSTDYVFDGVERTVGYDEESITHPLSRYAASKYAGEHLIRKKAERYYIIRLSKLFGRKAASPDAKRSFFEVMLEAGQNNSEVQVVNDEKSCFTYAPDLAVATKALVESGDPSGTFHLVNEGAVTWYEGVRELYAQAGIETKIIPIESSAFPRPARRPSFSVLLNTKRPKLRPYQEALKEFLVSQ